MVVFALSILCRTPISGDKHGSVECRCCSKDAIGFQTTVTAQIAQEEFTATGLMVTERNWLAVFRYQTWGGTEVPPLRPGDVFTPDELVLRQGQTEPPPKLSERDLLSLMDKFGIGTDATVADHIQKQQVQFPRM
jgi:DNA topoisomerase III